MPWCPACQRFLSPPTVGPDGTCPSCGRPVEPGRARTAESQEQEREELPAIPFHLKLLGIALVVYLGYRFFQGVEWLIHHFF
jgi:predicted nucleic acid-binding Zn ribbon protein